MINKFFENFVQKEKTQRILLKATQEEYLMAY